MRRVIVTGAGSPIGRRVVSLLQPDYDVSVLPSPADVVVHLSPGTTRHVLEALDNMAPTSLVLLSSATVYGAWADNPVPITEDAPLRPNPGVADAVQHAEDERLVAAWADEHPGVAVAVLRPATVIAPGTPNPVADALTGQGFVRPPVAEPDRQFVHVDDVASAVALAAREGLDGVFNVAPSGAVPADVARALGAWHPRVALPAPLAGWASKWAWALRLSPLPPGALPLVEQPWVVASDRLQAAGWAPRYTNEEAVVAGRSPSWWREMGPGRRQAAALAVTGVAAVSAVAASAVVAARARRRRVSSGGG